MIISCPNCSTQFVAPDDAFAHDARKVRCSYCHYVWVQPPSAPPPPPPPEPHVPEPSVTDDDLDVPIPAALLDQARFEAEMAEAMAAEPGRGDRSEAEAGSQLLAEALAEADLSPQERLVEERRKRLGGSRQSLPEQKPKSQRGKRIAVLIGWLMLASFVASAPFVVWKQRSLVVKLLPASAKYFEMLGGPVEGVEIIGLELRELHSSYVTEEGKPMLVVSGEVHNVSMVERVVPPLRVAMKDESGKEVAAFTVMLPGHETLPAESRFSFNAKLPAPLDAARNIEIAFMAGFGQEKPAGAEGGGQEAAGEQGGKAGENAKQ